MRRSRALTVRIVASVALAAALLGLAVPAAKLWAQRPEELPKPAPSHPASAPVDLPQPAAEDKPVSSPEIPLPAAPAEPLDPRPAIEPVILAPSPPSIPPSPSSPPAPASAVPLDDPEGSARSFVEKSQKEADDAIKALSKEAETLRARLQKVEAGLARWQAVKGALESHGGGRQGWRSPDDGIPEPVLMPSKPGAKPAPARNRRGVVPAPDRDPAEIDAPSHPRREARPAPAIEPADELPLPRTSPPTPTPTPTPKRDAPEPAGELPKAAAN